MNYNLNISINKTIQGIIESINNREYIVFCGAGISRNSGLPIVEQFVPEVLSKMEVPNGEIQTIMKSNIPFELLMEILWENSQIDKILNIFNIGKPNTNHIFLAKLLKNNKIRMVVTTNFDTLLEKALKNEGMKENEDFVVIYNEKDFKQNFEKINMPFIVKIHGSVEDKVNMAITLKQIANNILTEHKKKIIEYVFSTGKHDNVLILGYSSSDTFDITQYIESISSNRKKVIYVEHSSEIDIQDICIKKENNPFKQYNQGIRLFYNTDQLVKNIWNSTLSDSFIKRSYQTDWKKNISLWYQESILYYSEYIKYLIPGLIYLNITQFKVALEYFKKSLKFCYGINHLEGIGRSHGNLGGVLVRFANYKEATEHHLQSLRIARELGDIQSEMISHENLGQMFIPLGEYNKAIEYLEEALKISKVIADKREEAIILAGLSDVYSCLKDYKTAIEYCDLSLDVAKENGYKQLEGRGLNNKGQIWKNLENYQEAQECYELALKIVKNIGDKQGEGLCLGNLGILFKNLGKYQEALEYYWQSLKIAEETGDRVDEQKVLGNIGSVYYESRIFEKAIEYHEMALNKAKEIKYIEGEGLSYYHIGAAFFCLGKYKNAIKYYEFSLNIFKSIFGNNHPNTITVESGISSAISMLKLLNLE